MAVPNRFIAVAGCLLALALTDYPCVAQSGFQEGDFVTWSAAGKFHSVAVTNDAVVFATDGGLYRVDRYSGRPIEPWISGIGSSGAVDLTGVTSLAWSETSSSLWAVRRGALLCYRWGIRRWNEIAQGGYSALGVKDGELYTIQGGQVMHLNPVTWKTTPDRKVSRDSIDWQDSRTERTRQGGYPNYLTNPFTFSYNPADGSLNDSKFAVFRPGAEAVDSFWGKRYVCYPGLGYAVVDERGMRQEIVEVGLSGPDVQGIAIRPNGDIWIGGNNDQNASGVTLYSRSAQTWKKFTRREYPGFESGKIADLMVLRNGMVLAATSLGLTITDNDGFNWRTYARLEGLRVPTPKCLVSAGGTLYLGGVDGLATMLLPNGPFFKIEERGLKDAVNCLATDGRTVWVGSINGLLQKTADGEWIELKGNDQIGSEPVRAIAIGADYIAAGGASGVRVYHPSDDSWTALLSSVYLRDGQILSMTTSTDYLWIGTDRGLFRYNPTAGSVIEYTTEQGLPSARIQRLIVESDSLWIGSPRGLTRFLWNRPGRDPN